MMNGEINRMDEVLWVQKYRPSTVEDTILPERIKKSFVKFVEDKSIPNLLLSGGPGMGKTTVALAMLKELECDYIIKNGSLNVNIDTLRREIASFASSTSFAGGRKYVILDEADNMSASHVQPALRNFMEEFSRNCGFILTCNYKNKLIEPVRSRLSYIDFSFNKEEKAQMAAQFFKRVCGILDSENVEYDKRVVSQVLKNYFPDFRRTIGELQTYSSLGKIDETILTNVKGEHIDEVMRLLANKKFTDMRKWVAANSDQDVNDFFRALYDRADSHIELSSIPTFVILLADYMDKASRVADDEINMVAFLTEVMSECSFK